MLDSSRATANQACASMRRLWEACRSVFALFQGNGHLLTESAAIMRSRQEPHRYISTARGPAMGPASFHLLRQ